VKILVNGAWRDTGAADLATALKELGYADSVVATAVNGEFVRRASRPSARLAMAIAWKYWAPMQGG